MYYVRSVEKDLEIEIGGTLEASGYIRRDPKTDYRYDMCCDVELLYEFLESTQSDSLARIARKWHNGESRLRPNDREKLARLIWKQIQDKGKLHALRNGVDIERVHLTLYYPRPATADNPATVAKYDANKLTYMRQVPANRSWERVVDVVTFVNGLTFSLHELKQSTNKQDYLDAQDQWCDSDPTMPLFTFDAGYIVAFAVDGQDASMTTKLAGPDTVFFPFDQGKGDGVSRTTGNPVPGPGEPYATHYIYDHTLSKESVTAYIYEYCLKVEGKNGNPDLIVFPRFHQFDLIEKLRTLVDGDPLSPHYSLVEHFAGSGKTWEIVWASYMFSMMANPITGDALYDKVIVVSNRIVLDDQLQRALKSAQNAESQMTVAESTRGLEDALAGNTRIICTTVQKMFHLLSRNTKFSNTGKRFHVLIDEIQSGYESKHMEGLKAILAASNIDTTPLDADSPEDLDLFLTNALTRQVEITGRPENLSFTVFSATPTESTYRVFGTPCDDGKMRAFHTYTMKQAVDEGYILNPLAYVIIYEPTFKAEKNTLADPEYVSNDVAGIVGAKALASPEAIKKKARVAADNFAEIVYGKSLHGQEKMQIMAASRREAVLYYQALVELSSIPKYKMIRPIVAFTGSLELDGNTYTEAGLNGFSDKLTAEKFATNAYNVMIVARKFMVGFDEKKLCTQFVDVRLSGVNAVQATTRIDRVVKGEDKQTLLILCRNTFKELVDAYRPFFTTDGARVTSPADLETLYGKILDNGVISAEDASAFFAVAAESAATGEKLIHNGEEYYKGTHERFLAADETDRRKVIFLTRKFDTAYMAASLTDRIEDVRFIEMKALTDALLGTAWFKIPERNGRGKDLANISRQVDVKNTNFTPVSAHSVHDIGAPDDVIGTTDFDFRDRYSQLCKEHLSAILKRINARFATPEEVSTGINALLNDLAGNPSEETKRAAANNTEEEFAQYWNKTVKDELIRILIEKDSKDPYYIAANDILGSSKYFEEVATMYRGYAYSTARENP